MQENCYLELKPTMILLSESSNNASLKKIKSLYSN